MIDYSIKAAIAFPGYGEPVISNMHRPDWSRVHFNELEIFDGASLESPVLHLVELIFKVGDMVQDITYS